MSELREAAQAALTAYETFRDVDDIDGLDDAIGRLRAALAQPEAEAEPVAWRTFDGEGGYDYRDFYQNEAYELEWKRLNPAYADWVTPLYAHPPRDEWRPAGDPPDTTRSVLIWLRFGNVETFGKTLGGPSGFAFQNGAITHWRDVTPPTTEGE